MGLHRYKFHRESDKMGTGLKPEPEKKSQNGGVGFEDQGQGCTMEIGLKVPSRQTTV